MATCRRPLGRATRTVMAPSWPMASSAFFTTLTSTCSIWMRSSGTRGGCCASSGATSQRHATLRSADADRISTATSCSSASTSQGTFCGVGSRTTSANPRISSPSCRVRLTTTSRAWRKSWRCSSGSSGA